MNNSYSLLQELRQSWPHLRPQLYFKASLTALSHAIEDAVLVGKGTPLAIANFQQERFYRQEVRRYQRIAQCTDQVYVLAVPESDFGAASAPYITIPLDPNDGLAQEWHLIVIDRQYSACIICREQVSPENPALLDQARKFRGIWSFDRQVCLQAAKLLLERILAYRPEWKSEVKQTLKRYGLTRKSSVQIKNKRSPQLDQLFTERLIAYLQASQFKLLRAYRAIAVQEGKERLINVLTAFIRRSLNPEQVLISTVQELGQVFNSCRCILYRCDAFGQTLPIEYESVAVKVTSMRGEIWSIAEHSLFREVLEKDEAIAIADISQDLGIRSDSELQAKFQQWQIRSCLLVPIRYQEAQLGMLEIHYCGSEAHPWCADEIALVVAIAAQVGIALMQAQAYTDLEALNRQLEAIERSQRNLIAIAGHELRTPLSTIRICLETLTTTPEIPTDLQQEMLQTALNDSDRLQQLIQDFLRISRLESGLVRWQIEPLSLPECLDLVISNLKTRRLPETLPQIILDLPNFLPPVQADGEGLTEVLIKLLDNACKFTPTSGQITVRAQIIDKLQMLEVIIIDTGRGIEPSQLESIFDRFYQEEAFLQRTIGGSGLGLAICRQIIQSLGGKIWATSAGKDRGSQFHLNIPISTIVLGSMSAL
ncbi:DICT sensory domain-containing protein [Microseira wollei]|nr:DICT sensory domain-containing protein [Microseira wollei]